MSLKSAMKNFNANIALLILRIGLGSMMLLAHGLPKLNHYPSATFPDPLGIGSHASMLLAILAECVGSVFLVLGLWTRYTLIPLIFTMLVAVFIVHAGDPFGKKELGLLYLFGYLTLFFSGPGKYSIDRRSVEHS